MSADQTPERASPRRPSRILVVDDEPSIRELLDIVLQREGYEVLLAESGRTAVDLLEREPIDLLISDIIARIVLAPQEIPVGIITALVGAPFFLWVLRRSKNQGYW